MFKKLMFAVVPMMMIAGNVFADDNANDSDLMIDASTIAVADANIVEASLDVDVDQLAADAGKEKKTDAIEACFHRCGYSHGGWGGYSSCYSSYNSCYSSCYSPCYTYNTCYQPYYSYTSYCVARPVYYSPCVCQPTCSSYWGCF